MTPTPTEIDVSTRLAALERRVAAACARAGRERGDVTVVAVSKGHDAAAVLAALAAGHTDFGENRAQELRAKAAVVGSGARWHFVGRLQRNKVRDVVGLAEVVHSVDRAELAEALAARAVREGGVIRVFAQVNAGGDPAKAGCAPDETPALIDRIAALDGLRCEGLMTVPPAGTDPRPVFARLRRLRDALHGEHPEVRGLSMGMSADFEAAIGEGATIIRVGEAVFGLRPRTGARRPPSLDTRAAAGAATPGSE